MMKLNRIIGSSLCAAALVLSGTPLAMAQVRKGGDGRALDANHSTRGRSNAVEGQVDYRARNAYITGNVGGLAAFKDTIPYRTSGALLTDVGSDDLFSVNRQAYSIPPSMLGSAGGSNVFRDPIVVETYTSLPRYPSQASQQFLVAPSGGVSTLARPDGAFGSFGTTSDVLADDQLTVLHQADGQTVQFSASPLLGVRSGYVGPRPEDATQQPGVLEFGVPAITDPLKPAKPMGPPPTENLTPEEQEARDQEAMTRTMGLSLQQGGSARVEARRQAVTIGMGTEAGYASRSPMVEPTTMLGLQMQPRRVGTSAETLDKRVERLEQAIFSKAAPRDAKPGDDVYMDILDQVRKYSAERALAGDAPKAGGNVLDEPTEEEVREAEAERLQAVREAFGLADITDRHSTQEQGPSVFERVQEEQEAARLEDEGEQPAEETPRAITRLIEKLDYDLPAVESLAGERQGQTNMILKRAESQMAEGSYFSAEASYRQILAQAPDHALARAGLVHAQMGAGMIRSAAFNLRHLYDSHPELIALRYDRKLLPATERLTWMQGELQKQINQGNARDAGLMLAYLGYQLEQVPLMRYGLAVSQRAAPRDPLLPVLRRIWLDEAPDAADDQATKPKDTQGRDAGDPDAPASDQSSKPDGPSLK